MLRHLHLIAVSKVDHEKQEIVVKTSNKKYYKRTGLRDVSDPPLPLSPEMYLPLPYVLHAKAFQGFKFQTCCAMT